MHVDGALVEGVETALLRGGEDGAGMTAGDVFLVSCTMDRTLTDDAPLFAPGAIDITKRRYDETHFEVDVLAVEDAWPGKIRCDKSFSPIARFQHLIASPFN